ncbi:hypothetical protein KFE25_006242 [Diacronema lutheri]|uniref:Uncharacterized protein n=1 Tax=Diacronema lutheri TaxID=2081491 RepID=A0A8J5XWI0_DIALT|nr:hypothetical protein KFE25_006242 [Diacronema lutheri]
MGAVPLLDTDPFRVMMSIYQQRHTDGGEGSASASDAGSTISTNPNSIFSNTATVRFGNVLSLEDFKGCPCPLDDIVEHERPRDGDSISPHDRSLSPRSPRSVRVNQSSRAASPVNHDDLGDGLGDEVVSNPPEAGDADDDGAAFGPGLGDSARDDDDALLQLAMYQSLHDRASQNGGPSSIARAAVLRAARVAIAHDDASREHGADARHHPSHFAPPGSAMSERARGKQPASALAYGSVGPGRRP